MKLSTKQIDATVSRDKEYMLADGACLYLRVRPGDVRDWVYKYMQDGQNYKLGLGGYPTVTLAEARARANQARTQRAAGLFPKAVKAEKKAESRKRVLDTFEKVSRAWHKRIVIIEEWSESYSHKVLRQLELHAFPQLGRTPIGLLDQQDILLALEKVSLAGSRETAIRLREAIQRIYRFAVTNRVLTPSENFMAPGVADFKLPTPQVRKHATILDPAKIGQLVRDLSEYKGHFITRCALRLMPLLFQRPGQVRFMEWEQLNLDAGLWTCPPRIMKLTQKKKNIEWTEDHLVPLPRQAVEILRNLYRLTGPSGPVFKSISRRSSESRFMSENTINAALRSMGYDTQADITGHGFRAMARSLIVQELGMDREWVERHLAHGSDEELGDAYDRAAFVKSRFKMVQAWADYLDGLANQGPVSNAGNVVSIRAA